ncbi:aldehyde dehydrogenase [Peribacillus cavernae]|uniref:Aldehyde dehydrogenase n=1 Tax=Peribacillus cavernae TaxID=1674310 RepID=A0A433HRW4_9BACI|nr:aldehyde dehydrogenase family protein [Peribacillus cavernae]MDQ0218833.1 aldehyde dehydrogenase (NAD+) [Peribacillus cavernae]RUQ31038.1 aldehyde dehydrogenase [Peribacillus cavernae]
MTVQVDIQTFPLFINGKWEPATGGETFDVHNPATGELVAKAAKASVEDVDKAVQAARDAFDKSDWKYMSPKDRSKVLNAIAHGIATNAEELVYLESISSGGTVRRIASNDILQMVDLFNTMAKFVLEYPFSETLPSPPFPGPAHNFVWREPIGVCAAITPWNMPMLIATWKIAPALAMGNTVVIKPASYTPLSTLKLAEIISQFVPSGVINVVTGAGAEVGEALVRHSKVDKVAFTGSTEVGRNIMSIASGTIKNTTLELGGKSPNIILEDADLDIAVPGSLFGVFLHSGQLCESGTRLFVPDKLYDQVVERLIALAETLKPGNPLDQQTEIGPVISRKQKETILSYIELGKQEGATLVCGGKEMTVSGCEGGHFIEPTIFTNVTNDMKIAREEIFGPVLSVIRYSDVEEAIAMANDSIYGLAAGIWTRDVNKAYAAARKLQAGIIWINDWHMLRNDAPFGGYKQSGIGREMGKHSLDAYTQLKHVHTSMVPELHKRSWYQILFSDSVQS